MTFFNDKEEFILVSDEEDLFSVIAENSYKDFDPKTEDSVKSLNKPKFESNIHDDFLGFDISAGETWIYPINLPVRLYQYNIVREALFKNTLVCLPTGLGKTFIAAVVMYNFYRWYPNGKIVFMAPTRPLVSQQIEACYNVMGIPQKDMIELTGTMPPPARILAWNEKRVYFLTPQVLANDLSRNVTPACSICCVVVDEAHRATGNHAYCQVIKYLMQHRHQFRILALSATPGSDVTAVKQVLQSLYISDIQLRSEESIDVAEYTFKRNIDKIVVPFGKDLSIIKNRFLDVLSPYISFLVDHKVLFVRDLLKLTKFQLLKSREAFRKNPPISLNRTEFGRIESHFALCMTLYHALELLLQHGTSSFYSFLRGSVSESSDKKNTRSELLKNTSFQLIMNDLKAVHEIESAENAQNDEIDVANQKVSSSNVLNNIMCHPKMEKLQEILTEHFKKASENNLSTKVMIFAQYRESVTAVTKMLKQHYPLIKAMSFIGQSSAGKLTKGLTQKEQLKVIKDFRNGGYNTLVSTSVGEEGLDIGDIDLIICYDVKTSPVCLVQRMGRTGRKKEGKIIFLISEGREEQMYNLSMFQKKAINTALLQKDKLQPYLCSSPRMVPDAFNPACQRLHMQINQWESTTNKRKRSIDTSSTSIGKLFSKISNKKGKEEVKTCKFNNYMTEEEWNWYVNNIELKSEVKRLKASSLNIISNDKDDRRNTNDEECINLSKYQAWQTVLQKTSIIGHSKRSDNFVRISHFIDIYTSGIKNNNAYELEMASFLKPKYTKQGNCNNGYDLNSSKKLKRFRKSKSKVINLKGDISSYFSQIPVTSTNDRHNLKENEQPYHVNNNICDAEMSIITKNTSVSYPQNDVEFPLDSVLFEFSDKSSVKFSVQTPPREDTLINIEEVNSNDLLNYINEIMLCKSTLAVTLENTIINDEVLKGNCLKTNFIANKNCNNINSRNLSKPGNSEFINSSLFRFSMDSKEKLAFTEALLNAEEKQGPLGKPKPCDDLLSVNVSPIIASSSVRIRQSLHFSTPKTCKRLFKSACIDIPVAVSTNRKDLVDVEKNVDDHLAKELNYICTESESQVHDKAYNEGENEVEKAITADMKKLAPTENILSAKASSKVIDNKLFESKLKKYTKYNTALVPMFDLSLDDMPQDDLKVKETKHSLVSIDQLDRDTQSLLTVTQAVNLINVSSDSENENLKSFSNVIEVEDKSKEVMAFSCHPEPDLFEISITDRLCDLNNKSDSEVNSVILDDSGHDLQGKKLSPFSLLSKSGTEIDISHLNKFNDSFNSDIAKNLANYGTMNGETVEFSKQDSVCDSMTFQKKRKFIILDESLKKSEKLQKISPIKNCHKLKKTHIVSENSDDDDFILNKSECVSKDYKKKRKKKKILKKNSFIDNEAQVSLEVSLLSSDESDSSFEATAYDRSFVNDGSCFTQNYNADMHAVYLKSVCSPTLIPLKRPEKPLKHDVCSQVSPGESEEEYGDDGDSFVVDNDYVEYESSKSIMECTLPSKKSVKKKRKRIIADSSNDDDIEELHSVCSLTNHTQTARTEANSVKDYLKSSPQKLFSKTTDNFPLHTNNTDVEKASKICSVSDTSVNLHPVMAEKEYETNVYFSTKSEPNFTDNKVMLYKSISSSKQTQHKFTFQPVIAKGDFSEDNDFLLKRDFIEDKKYVSVKNSRTNMDRKYPLSKGQNSGAKNFASYKDCKMPQSATVTCTEKTDFSKRLDEDMFVSPDAVELGKDEASTSKVISLIFVSNTEVSKCGMISVALRQKHNFEVATAQLDEADYVVSVRTCVMRVYFSYFCNSGNRSHLVKRVQCLLGLYDKLVIIIEDDPVKNTVLESFAKLGHSRYLDTILCATAQLASLKVLYSSSHDNSCELVNQLAQVECIKGYRFPLMQNAYEKLVHVVMFYKSIPQVSFASAVCLAYNYRDIQEFCSRLTHPIKDLRCKKEGLSGYRACKSALHKEVPSVYWYTIRFSPKSLQIMGHLSSEKAAMILLFIKRKFYSEMVPSDVR